MIKRFWNWIVIIAAQHRDYPENHSVAHFQILKTNELYTIEMVNVMLYEFYINKKKLK